jgi:hypothetical protein
VGLKGAGGEGGGRAGATMGSPGQPLVACSAQRWRRHNASHMVVHMVVSSFQCVL